MGTFIYLPEATPLDLGFALGKFCNEVVDFSRQLVEGVTFLHRYSIAQLDIEPQNIVGPPQDQVSSHGTITQESCTGRSTHLGHRHEQRYPKSIMNNWFERAMLQCLARQKKRIEPAQDASMQLMSKTHCFAPSPLLCLRSSVKVGHVTGYSLSKLQYGLKRKPKCAVPHEDAKQLGHAYLTQLIKLLLYTFRCS